MTVRITVHRAEPHPGSARGRATREQIKAMGPRLRVIRTCCHCGTVYRSGGYAWNCEHWHERE